MFGKKVLVIDDDPSIVRLDQALLSSQGYEVIAVSDGLEGLQKAEEENPDIILLDIILPGMHGFELCKKLRENEKTKSIPVILVTASGLEEVAEQESDIPADGYISKPYGIDDLLHAIDQTKKKE